MNRKLTVSLVAWACLGFVGAIFGQDSGGAWRLTYQDRTAAKNPVATYFDTRQQAEAWQQNLVQDNTTSRGLGLAVNYFDFRIEKVSEADRKDKITDQSTAISYAGEAAKALRDKLHLKFVKRGDTLREYAQVVRGSFRNAKQLRSTLLSMTGSIERRTFDQINAKIDEYNKQADAYNKLVGEPETILQLQQENGGKIVGAQDYPEFDTVAPVRPDQLKGTLEKGSAANLDKSAKSNAAKRFVGTWDGTMQQEGVTFPVTIEITEFQQGKLSGVLKHADPLDAEGVLRGVSIEGNTMTLYATIFRGRERCLDGQSVLTLIDDNTMERVWIDPSTGKGRAKGVLKRQ